MKFNGIYSENTAKSFSLRLVKVNDYVELQAVGEDGCVLNGGHLMRISKNADGSITFNAYSGVSKDFNMNVDSAERIIVKNFF